MHNIRAHTTEEYLQIIQETSDAGVDPSVAAKQAESPQKELTAEEISRSVNTWCRLQKIIGKIHERC